MTPVFSAVFRRLASRSRDAPPGQRVIVTDLIWHQPSEVYSGCITDYGSQDNRTRQMVLQCTTLKVHTAPVTSFCLSSDVIKRANIGTNIRLQVSGNCRRRWFVGWSLHGSTRQLVWSTASTPATHYVPLVFVLEECSKLENMHHECMKRKVCDTVHKCVLFVVFQKLAFRVNSDEFN